MSASANPPSASAALACELDPEQLELAHLREAEGGHGGHFDLEQELALLAREEVPELDHEAVLDADGGEVVEERDRVDGARRAHGERGGLDDLLQQPVDLRGERRRGRVAL